MKKHNASHKEAESTGKISDGKRKRILKKFLRKGVLIPCCDGVIIAPDCIIGKGTVILPSTIIKEGCTIGSNCVIGPSTVLYKTTVGKSSTLNNVQAEQAEIADNVSAGPFVRIRPGTVLKNGVHVGNFVEIKNSVVGEKTKLPHLSYIGDSDVGQGANFGCGCATANFNGKSKNRCTVGDGAFIGCHTSLIAPVEIGERAYIAAGSVITESVPSDALAVARSRQTNKQGWVAEKKPYRSSK